MDFSQKVDNCPTHRERYLYKQNSFFFVRLVTTFSETAAFKRKQKKVWVNLALKYC